MLINQVIEQARSGELSNLTNKSYTDDKIITYINLGLLELYKRFNLHSTEVIVTMVDNVTTYTVDGTDSNVTISTEADLLMLMEAYDEAGIQLPINKENDEYAVLTPTYNTVQVPYPVAGERLSLIYSAGPTYIATGTQVLQLPVSLLEALLHYIGYRSHGARDGALQAENNSHYQRFEASCRRAISLGLVTEDEIPETDVQQKGFV